MVRQDNPVERGRRLGAAMNSFEVAEEPNTLMVNVMRKSNLPTEIIEANDL